MSAPPRVRVETTIGEVQRDDALYADGRKAVTKVEHETDADGIGYTRLHYRDCKQPSQPRPSDYPVFVWRRPIRRGDLVIVGKRGRNVSMVSRLDPHVDLVPPRFEPWLTRILAECGDDNYGHGYAAATRVSSDVRGDLVRLMTYELANAWAATLDLAQRATRMHVRLDEFDRVQACIDLAVARGDDDPAAIERVQDYLEGVTR